MHEPIARSKGTKYGRMYEKTEINRREIESKEERK
jgi:hypothetical protein